MTTSDPSDTFRQEARELLDELEQILLDLDKNPTDSDLINGAFRALHTIKGSGAMFGFTEVANFVHGFETAFDVVRKGQRSVTPGLIAVALEAKDHVLKLVEDPAASASAGEPIIAALNSVTEDSFSLRPTRPQSPEPAPETPSQLLPWRLIFTLPTDCVLNGTNPLLLLDELRAIGPATVTALGDNVPLLSDLDPELCHLTWQVDISCAHDPSGEIDDVFLFLRDEMTLSLERLSDPDHAENASVSDCTPAESGPIEKTEAPKVVSAESDAPVKTGSPGTSLRVPAERLDELMDRVGELVIAQARLTQIAGHSTDVNLKSVAEELERLSSGLRDTTMGIRMVPIGTLFGRFRRLVHDLSLDLGKDIEFITSGEETELDKTMIERLADPLVHLIRNSVDHGLEKPEKRRATGKPEKGVVRLSAIYSGAEVAISVSDDGAGLNPERIRAKAEEAGLLLPETKIADVELWQMIFAPGFSTASEVTSLSGRGVGMDVVKRTIDGLRGAIDVTTTPGKGTTITLRLPLTLAIIDGMLVRVGGGRYTIPLAAVEECVELPEGVEANARGRNFLDIRGSLVPFLRLRDVFGATGAPDEHQKVVIVSSGEGRVGLVVDQIIGNNQTVIKQLSKLHSNVKSFSGATILGDGSVALILDHAHLVASGQKYVELNRGRAA